MPFSFILFAVSHPVALLLLLNLTSTIILALTPPSSPVRPAVLIILLLGVWWSSLPNYSDRVHRVPWAAFLAGNVLTSVLQFVELGLLRAWTFGDHGLRLRSDRIGSTGKTTTARNVSLRELGYFGYFVATSTRHIGTPFAVKGIPAYSSTDPGKIPSRANFVVERAAIGLSSYLVLDLFALGARVQHAQNSKQLGVQVVPVLARISGITWQEVGTRTQDTLGYYVFCYCLIQCYTSFVACAVVALHVDQPRDWRPNFGRLDDAYSLRQFWGQVSISYALGYAVVCPCWLTLAIQNRVFWHQHLRSKLTALSAFVTHRVLGLRKGFFTARYTNVFLAFFISGSVHWLTVYAAGLTLLQACAAFQYFCAQVLGIMIEDGVQAMYRRLAPQSGGSQKHPPLWWARALGYLWVAAFLTWSTPAFIYAMVAANKGGDRDEILPFSPLTLLQGTANESATR
ncbi:hypothetical protein MMC11_007454 [Xylographa trunciseda]|nr:hypothetical protein [Xylographa trunciseda]